MFSESLCKRDRKQSQTGIYTRQEPGNKELEETRNLVEKTGTNKEPEEIETSSNGKL